MDNQAFQLLSDTLKRIEDKIDAVTQDHDTRIDSLESTRDKQSGMARMAIIIAACISSFVTFVVNVISKH